MEKNCLALILLLCCSYSFAQSTEPVAASKVAAVPLTDSQSVSQTTVQANNNASPNPVFEKKPLPQALKAAPAIFYITNDLPCDRKAYMLHLKPVVPKN